MSSDVVWRITHPKEGVVALGANSTYPKAWFVMMSHLPLKPATHLNDDEYAIYCSARVNPTVAELGGYTVTMGPA